MEKIRKIAILGFGNEGQAVLKFLKREGELKNSEVWILDKSEKVTAPRGTKAQLGKDYLKNLSRFAVIYRSPGVPYLAKELVTARKNGVGFSSSTKLFFEKCPCPIIGVTGTKGKGTTSTLLYKIFKAHRLRSGQAAKKVFLAGNIGLPAVSILSNLKKNFLVVLELSSFQLQDLEISPKISVVLEVFPDHQDSHKNLAEYYSSKANVAKYQKAEDAVFFFGDKKKSAWVAAQGTGKKISILPQGSAELDEEELKIKGPHNFRNAVLALAVAEYLGVAKKTAVKVIRDFRGLEHRLEFVRAIGNVTFYNDSASTNPHTSAAALRSFRPKETAIILGGYDKGLDYSPVAKAIKEKKPKLVILLGANSKKIQKAIKGTGVKIKFAENLPSAIRAAYSALREDSKPSPQSNSVIFSPGSASFDMFRNYAHRGEEFKKIVKSL